MKKLTSVRRGDVQAAVYIDLSPWADDDEYPVEVRYAVGVPAGKEPADLVWGVTGSAADTEGRVRLVVNQFGDEALVAELAHRVEDDVVPFLDRFGSPADLASFFASPWEDAERRYLEPRSAMKRAQYFAFLADVAGQPALAQRGRAELVAVAEAGGMTDYIAESLAELDDRLARWRQAQ